MKNKDQLLLLFFALVLVIEFFVFQDLPAFWDAKSKFIRADWLYQNGLSNVIVPTELNSGHPPLWIWSIAFFWGLFGKTLWAARLLLLLVNFGVFFQILQLAKHTFSKSVPLVMVLLLCIEPTLIAQTTNLNNDMMLLFFVLLGLNTLFRQFHFWYAIALLGMLFTNLRGIYCFLALVIIHMLIHRQALVFTAKRFLFTYVVAIVIFGAFLLFQYNELGWVIITPNKTYSGHREAVGFMKILKNTAAYGKNLLDFGRIFVWVPLLFFLFKAWRKKHWSNNTKLIGSSLFVFTTIFFLGMVPFSNPMGPRYLMICFLLANLLFIILLYESGWLKKLSRRTLVFVAIFAFLTGHFWIYPPNIAQGWDSSLAYLNYYPQERKLFEFMEKSAIEAESVGTNLPLGTRWISLVKDDNSEDPHFADLDLNYNTYVLFSNIDNRTSDDDIVFLKEYWEVVYESKQLGVFMTLYKNPDAN